MATTASEVTASAPPMPARPRLRAPQLVVGVLLMAGAALAFLLVNAASVHRVAVVALVDDVSHGQVLTEQDLQVVHVGTDDPIALTAADEADALVGRAVVTDLRAGTLVVPEQLAVASTLTPGSGVVGLALTPGQYPTPQLRIGDLVNVVAADAAASEESGRLLVEAAEVVWVEPIGTQGQRFVSVLTGEEQAGQVAATAARGEVRLVLVARDDEASS